MVSSCSLSRPISTSIALTERIRSCFESISVPSKSKISARTRERGKAGIRNYFSIPLPAFPVFSDFSALRVNYEGFRAGTQTAGDSMAQVFPFRALRYNPALVPLERVLTQPYDKISRAMQDKYYAADPHNLITVENGRSNSSDTTENNVYTRAATALS